MCVWVWTYVCELFSHESFWLNVCQQSNGHPTVSFPPFASDSFQKQDVNSEEYEEELQADASVQLWEDKHIIAGIWPNTGKAVLGLSYVFYSLSLAWQGVFLTDSSNGLDSILQRWLLGIITDVYNNLR